MSLPAGYYRIDPDIRALVAAMNVHGFRTYASCQGHGFPVTKLPPYIAFVCPVKKAALLEQRLRQDAESMMPRLLWGWSVGASFNSDLQLCFRLQPEGPHYWQKQREFQDRRTVRADSGGEQTSRVLV